MRLSNSTRQQENSFACDKNSFGQEKTFTQQLCAYDLSAEKNVSETTSVATGTTTLITNRAEKITDIRFITAPVFNTAETSLKSSANEIAAIIPDAKQNATLNNLSRRPHEMIEAKPIIVAVTSTNNSSTEADGLSIAAIDKRSIIDVATTKSSTIIASLTTPAEKIVSTQIAIPMTTSADIFMARPTDISVDAPAGLFVVLPSDKSVITATAKPTPADTSMSTTVKIQKIETKPIITASLSASENLISNSLQSKGDMLIKGEREQQLSKGTEPVKQEKQQFTGKKQGQGLILPQTSESEQFQMPCVRNTVNLLNKQISQNKFSRNKQVKQNPNAVTKTGETQNTNKSGIKQPPVDNKKQQQKQSNILADNVQQPKNQPTIQPNKQDKLINKQKQKSLLEKNNFQNDYLKSKELPATLSHQFDKPVDKTNNNKKKETAEINHVTSNSSITEQTKDTPDKLVSVHKTKYTLVENNLKNSNERNCKQTMRWAYVYL